MDKGKIQKDYSKRAHHRNRLIKNRVSFRKNTYYNWDVDYPGRYDKGNTFCSCYLCKPHKYSKKPRERIFREDE